MSGIPNAASCWNRKRRCDRRLLLVGTCWLLFVVSGSIDTGVVAANVSEKQLRTDSSSPERAETSGDVLGIWKLGRYLFGSWREAFFACRRTDDPDTPGDSTFQTRWSGLIRTLFRASRKAKKDDIFFVREVRGTCPQVCSELCACHPQYEIDDMKGTCTCKGQDLIGLCGSNAKCSYGGYCDCKPGYYGSGYTCCGTSLFDRYFCNNSLVYCTLDDGNCRVSSFDPVPPKLLSLNVLPDGNATTATTSTGAKVARVRLTSPNFYYGTNATANMTGKVIFQMVIEDRGAGVLNGYLEHPWWTAGLSKNNCQGLSAERRPTLTRNCTFDFVSTELSHQNRSMAWTLPLTLVMEDLVGNRKEMNTSMLESGKFISAVELYVAEPTMPLLL